MVNVVKTRKI
jgi:hypothetical protein